MAGLKTRLNSSALTTGTSVKTLVQVVAPTNHRLLVSRVKVSFNGVTAADAPILCEILRQTSAGSMSSLTPVKFDNTYDETIQQTAQENSTSEPSAGDIMEKGYAHPQGGIFEWVALRREDYIPVPGGGRLGVRVTAGVSVTSETVMEVEE